MTLFEGQRWIARLPAVPVEVAFPVDGLVAIADSLVGAGGVEEQAFEDMVLVWGHVLHFVDEEVFEVLRPL